jgi:hypothetical protein
VLGQNHVIVAPPSIHPSGRTYQFEPELGFDETKPQPAPKSLLDLIRSRLPSNKLPPPPLQERDSAAFPPTFVEPILQGCAWMRHCKEDAPQLSEPEWYGMLTVLGRCENANNLAQEFSGGHSGYRPDETAAKLQHAVAAPGPLTCAKIRNSLGGERFCQDCPNWGKIKSPITLGMPARRAKVNGAFTDLTRR